MRKKTGFTFYLLLSAFLLCGTGQTQAAGNASKLLERLSGYFRSLGDYRVTFEVEADGRGFPGYYCVAGDRYYLSLGDAEVYGEGGVRYEVDNARREVVIDRVDTASRNLLSNPTRAFDFVDDEFAAEQIGSAEGVATVRLMPRATDAAVSWIDLRIEEAAGRPQSVSYRFDGERIGIEIRSVTAEKETLKPFDKARYAGYELIDFR